jgi:hypothetical protein
MGASDKGYGVESSQGGSNIKFTRTVKVSWEYTFPEGTNEVRGRWYSISMVCCTYNTRCQMPALGS